jgi:beta-N-acetylhexosaminidase
VDRSAADRRAAHRRRLVARRRRNLLLALGAAAAVGGVIVGARAGDDEGAGGEAAERGRASVPSCPVEIASDPRRLAGSLVVARMEDTAADQLLRLARRGELGGVILFPSPGVDQAALADQIDQLGAAARGAGFPEPLVLIDQEGGEVKRLPDEPPELAPAELAGAGDAEAARAQGVATGRALERIGVDVDLAPVLDLGSPGSFVAERAFGDDPAVVSELGLAFAAGLERAGVAATVKHFPGLGEATANTDLGASLVGASRRQLGPGLRPFEEAIAASVPAVMVSNAIYSAYDAERPAGVSPRIVDGLLRRSLGFDGVVITDDLGAGAIAATGLDEGGAAVAAAHAGADLFLYAASEGEAAREALTAAQRREPALRASLRSACERVSALRDRFG